MNVPVRTILSVVCLIAAIRAFGEVTPPVCADRASGGDMQRVTADRADASTVVLARVGGDLLRLELSLGADSMLRVSARRAQEGGDLPAHDPLRLRGITSWGVGSGTGLDAQWEHPLPPDPAGVVTTRPLRISPFTVQTDAVGAALHAYFGDSAGRVWRIDFPDTDDDGDNWGLSLVARLGSGEFFDYAGVPALVSALDRGGSPFTGVLLTTERRGVSGAGGMTLYYLRDYAPFAGGSGLPPIVPDDLADLDACAGRDAHCVRRHRAGWRMATTLAGRRASDSALIEGGRVFLSLSQAAGNPCSTAPTPTGLLAMELADGAPVYAERRIHPLGEHAPGRVEVSGGRLHWPGWSASEAGLRELANPRGIGVFRLGWRDIYTDG